MPARSAARVLISAMFWTIVAYFIWHSLHARVEANWFAPVYPAFAIAAAVAAHSRAMGAAPAAYRRFLPALGGADRHRDVCAVDRAGQYRRAARAIAATPPCAASASAGANWPARSKRCGRASARLACWRRITAPPAGSPSICRRAPAWCSQRQRIRWVNMPEPDPALLAGKLLLCRRGAARRPAVSEGTCSRGSKESAELTRKRGPLDDRNLRARSARRRQGAQVLGPLSAAGTGVGGGRGGAFRSPER